MNIFKVFASAKKGFQEEYASAILTWFMNPYMEHGLGYVFLAEFLGEMGRNLEKEDPLKKKLDQVAEALVPRMRSNGGFEPDVKCYLEYNAAGMGFVDIVFVIDDFVLAIENKIFPESASDSGQLAREYKGLREGEFSGKKILMVFLVPLSGESLHKKIDDEYVKLKTEPSDFKTLFGWSDHSQYPSVVAVISAVLLKEAEGKIDPIQEYTKHSLKAFRKFIMDDFSGYEFEREKTNGVNPMTEENLNPPILNTKTEGFVGIQGGIIGLINHLIENKNKDRFFQYTSQNMENVRNWISIGLFKKIIALKDVKKIEIDYSCFNKKYHSTKMVLWLAEKGETNFFVGLKGGENRFTGMTVEEIYSRKWLISAIQISEQWFPGKRFHEAIQRKESVGEYSTRSK